MTSRSRERVNVERVGRVVNVNRDRPIASIAGSRLLLVLLAASLIACPHPATGLSLPSSSQQPSQVPLERDCLSSARKDGVIPAAFLVPCDGVLSKNNPGARSPSALSWRRARQSGRMSLRMGMLDNLREVLRGGGPFRREGNEAKYTNRPRVGIEVSSTMAVALSALSVVLVSGALPQLWGVPSGLWQSFWLTRIVLLRAVSLVYFVAFAVAFNQNTALIGDKGLLPASGYLKRLREQNQSYGETGMNWAMFNSHPTWLWLAPQGCMDECLRGTAALGMLLSAAVLVNGGSNVIIQLVLWLLYHSIVTVGQRWYSFGWESQLLETGFISVLMVPLLSVSPLPLGFATPWVSLWALRWLCFRIMIGAGMIKIRGDSCWRDLTAMCYHYETQPVPNPFSYFLHWTPLWWHKFETSMNHVIELVLPWLLLLPLRSLVLVGGLSQLLFQATLVLSGNLSFLNWLTMVPPIAAFDDAALAFLFSPATIAQVTTLNAASHTWTFASIFKEGVYAVVCAFLVWLSAPVIRNILSQYQVMNTSFGSWRFVNTYGAFGSITRVREEVIIQGTHADPDKHWDNDVWKEYFFKVKPGEVSRCPPWISPYHYRLDWLLWFLPFSDPRRNPWVYHLFGKLMANDSKLLKLIRSNPFNAENPPKYIRAELYKYEYTRPGSEAANKGDWWERTRMRSYIAPHTLDDLGYIYDQFGWPSEELPQNPKDTQLEPEDKGGDMSNDSCSFASASASDISKSSLQSDYAEGYSKGSQASV